MDIFGHKVSPKYNGVAGGSSGPVLPTNLYLSNVDPTTWTLAALAFVQDALGPAGQPAWTGTDSGFGQHRGTKTLSGSATHFAIAAKAGTLGFITLWRFGTAEGAIFNLGTGAVTNLATPPLAASATAIGGGWYLCDVTFSAAASTDWGLRVADSAPNADPGAGAFTANGTVLVFNAAAY